MNIVGSPKEHKINIKPVFISHYRNTEEHHWDEHMDIIVENQHYTIHIQGNL